MSYLCTRFSQKFLGELGLIKLWLKLRHVDVGVQIRLSSSLHKKLWRGQDLISTAQHHVKAAVYLHTRSNLKSF